MERPAKRKDKTTEEPVEYATLEEFCKLMAPIAGKALGEAVRHLASCRDLKPITIHKQTA